MGDRQQSIISQIRLSASRSSRFAFTLAEVLIVIGIIGIIAEITIPTLIHNINEQSYKVAYKSAYSTLSQAWTMAATNGDITPCANWGDWSGGTCNLDNFNALKKYLKVTKDCPTNASDCWNMSGEQSWADMGGRPNSDAPAFVDASGIVWSKNSQSPAAEVLVDTNGSKLPNRYGKDRFVLSTYYYTFDISILGLTGYSAPAGVAKVGYETDIPGPYYAIGSIEAKRRCPSLATDPNYHCYYTSWITGG